tara:strand:- start:723 stop:1598 length:876 start_codon:yes stop_codon:yes gene_type:complete
MKCTVKQSDRIASYKSCCDYAYQAGGPIPTGDVFSIWCHTHDLSQLLYAISQIRYTRYVIVAHASDFGITQDIIDVIPPNVIKVFSQNVIHRDDRVESIPIGSIGSTWIGTDEWSVKHQDDGSYCGEYMAIEESGEEKDIQNLALMDFAVHSNPSERTPIYEHLKNEPWVTTNLCDASYQQHEQSDFHSMERYFKGIYNHKFIISPLGNGVDCGRNWQAIYLGSIAVIPRHVNIEYYENDLPILVYDDIESITEEYLHSKWDEINNRKYNLEKATLPYWKERISNARNVIL